MERGPFLKGEVQEEGRWILKSDFILDHKKPD